MEYRFKLKAELLWIAIGAATFEVLTALVTFEPTAITDWRLWAVSLGGAAVRSAAGAVIAYVTRPQVSSRVHK